MAKVKTVASFDPANPTIIVEKWSDGVERRIDLNDLPEAVFAFCAWHGVKQLRGDTHSGIFAETGSVALCREASDAKWDSLLSGEIYQSRSSNPWIYEALAEIWDCEVEEAAEAHAKLPEATQKALLETAEVRKWKAKRDLARADAMESKVDVGSLFVKKPAGQGSK